MVTVVMQQYYTIGCTQRATAMTLPTSTLVNDTRRRPNDRESNFQTPKEPRTLLDQ